MRMYPFERWVMLSEAPDLHQDTEALVKVVSYSRRKADPNTGRWYRVHEISEECPKYLSHGAPVLANLSMLSDNITIGDETLALMPFSQCAAIRISEAMMRSMHARHPVIPVGDYVLCIDNDAKHRRLLGLPSTTLQLPLSTLTRGQRTDEQYETKVDEDGFEHANPNRENDGTRMMFTEVAMVGPEVPGVRGLEPGDMVAFRPNCGIKFDLYGVSYRLLRCPERNSEIVGRVPAKDFE